MNRSLRKRNHTLYFLRDLSPKLGAFLFHWAHFFALLRLKNTHLPQKSKEANASRLTATSAMNVIFYVSNGFKKVVAFTPCSCNFAIQGPFPPLFSGQSGLLPGLNIAKPLKFTSPIFLPLFLLSLTGSPGVPEQAVQKTFLHNVTGVGRNLGLQKSLSMSLGIDAPWNYHNCYHSEHIFLKYFLFGS